MTTENLFEGVEDNLPPIDDSKDYLNELVGEGKKFKTVAELARGKYEADIYVQTLTNRIDDLRKDHLALREDSVVRAKLEDLLNKIEQRQTSSELPQANDVENKPGYDPEEVDARILSKIQEIEQRKKESANYTLVQSKLKERYGRDYLNVLQEQTDRLGLEAADVNALAKKSPQAFFNVLGLDVAKSDTGYQAPPRSDTRSDTFAPRGAPKRTWSYYQDLKKSNPTIYLDPKIAVQMQNDVLEMGEDAFYGTAQH